MTPLPAVPNVVKLTLNSASGVGADFGIRLFFSFATNAPTSTQLNALCTAVGTSWGAHIAGITTNAYILTRIEAIDLTTASANVGVATVDFPGTRVGQNQPNGVATLVNHHIQRRYRGGKPRTYLPPGANADLASVDTWTAAFITAANAAFASFIGDITLNGGLGVMQHVNVSFYEGEHAYTTSGGKTKYAATVRTTPPPVPVDVVTSSSVNPTFGSQRRRYQR